MRTEAHEPCALERKQVPRKLRREKSALREFPHEILAEETDQSTRGPQSSAALDANMNSHTGNNFEALQQAIYKQQQQQHPMGAGRGPNHAAERSISTSSSSKPRDVRMETGGNTEVTADMVQSLLSQLPAESFQGNFQFSDPDAGGIGELSPNPGVNGRPPPPFLANKAPHERNAYSSNSEMAHTAGHRPIFDAFRDSNLPSNLSVFQPSSRPSLIRREKKRRAIPIGAGARAVKTPLNADFPIGLAQPLIQSLVDGGEPLNALEHQKLLDTTTLLQSMGVHVLEPLTLYTKRELYEVMGSIAEVWKNSGKAAMKKKINKIRSNARKRKAPRNVLDAAEMKQIELLQKQIKDREHWEDAQRSRLKDAKSSNASVTPSKAESETSEMLTSYSPSAL
ncbi:Hypothetical Protein FCC1311_014642 [Hondaea fermentalgiana]|uniref:Uncharacterized protein n=1 Tax=Hondaea fermentalgiana TaxID=2315210 RepID=A0A2R5G2I8_9STRA|nr:Hypothetical Protein FCC1311_014642 [Hondaea fermentalgiana]|eukprot:GBG25247.1 Hypothetical Protein FCC1311_014642 [Hondaea fermentalgiana]